VFSYRKQVPRSAAKLVGALRLHPPASEAGHVLVPVCTGANPYDSLHAAVAAAVAVHVLANQGNAARIHKQPRRRFARERLQEARALHRAVMQRRQMAVGAGRDFDADKAWRRG
jgi:hypothetical protein